MTDGEENISFIELSVSYDEEAEQDLNEDSLQLYRFVDNEWVEIPGSSVDTDANIVSANITEFPAESFVVAPFANSADETEDGGDGADEATDSDGTSDDKDSKDGADRDVDREADGEKNGKHVEIGDHDVRLALGDIVIEDLDLSGPGLPDEHIDERTYKISGFTVDIDGVSVVVGETAYSIGALSVEVESLTVTLENITLHSS